MQSALDKRSTRRWKETMLRDLDAATAGLIGGTDQDHDTRLAASRKIVGLVDNGSTRLAVDRGASAKLAHLGKIANISFSFLKELRLWLDP